MFKLLKKKNNNIFRNNIETPILDKLEIDYRKITLYDISFINVQKMFSLMLLGFFLLISFSTIGNFLNIPFEYQQYVLSLFFKMMLLSISYVLYSSCKNTLPFIFSKYKNRKDWKLKESILIDDKLEKISINEKKISINNILIEVKKINSLVPQFSYIKYDELKNKKIITNNLNNLHIFENIIVLIKNPIKFFKEINYISRIEKEVLEKKLNDLEN